MIPDVTTRCGLSPASSRSSPTCAESLELVENRAGMPQALTGFNQDPSSWHESSRSESRPTTIQPTSNGGKVTSQRGCHGSSTPIGHARPTRLAGWSTPSWSRNSPFPLGSCGATAQRRNGPTPVRPAATSVQWLRARTQNPFRRSVTGGASPPVVRGRSRLQGIGRLLTSQCHPLWPPKVELALR